MEMKDFNLVLCFIAEEKGKQDHVIQQVTPCSEGYYYDDVPKDWKPPTEVYQVKISESQLTDMGGFSKLELHEILKSLEKKGAIKINGLSYPDEFLYGEGILEDYSEGNYLLKIGDNFNHVLEFYGKESGHTSSSDLKTEKKTKIEEVLSADTIESEIWDFMVSFPKGTKKEWADVYEHLVGEEAKDCKRDWRKVRDGISRINEKTVSAGFGEVLKYKTKEVEKLV